MKQIQALNFNSLMNSNLLRSLIGPSPSRPQGYTWWTGFTHCPTLEAQASFELGQQTLPFRCYFAALHWSHISSTKRFSPENLQLMSHEFPHGTILKHLKYFKITKSMAVSAMAVRFIAQLPAKNTRVPKDPLLASHNRPNVARTNHSTSYGEGWPDLLECFLSCWRYDLSIHI